MKHEKRIIEGVIRERVRMLNYRIVGSERPPFMEHSEEDIERVASAFCASGVASLFYFWMRESPPTFWMHTSHSERPGEGFELVKVNYVLCDEFMMNPNEVEIGKAILAHIPNPSGADKALVDQLAFVVRKRRIRGPRLVKP